MMMVFFGVPGTSEGLNLEPERWTPAESLDIRCARRILVVFGTMDREYRDAGQ